MAYLSRKSKASIGLLLVAVGIGIYVTYSEAPVRNVFTAPKKEEKVVPVTLTFVGDIMMDRSVRGKIEKYFDGDYNTLFINTQYLNNADIAFGNLEGAVGSGGRRVGSKYSFQMDPKSLDAMANAGFDIVSFANNHVGDYAQGGFDETLANLSTRGIRYAGAGTKAQAFAPIVFMVRGTTIGFLAVTDVGPTWLPASIERTGTVMATDPAFLEAIKAADSAVDVLVVSVHWGAEYSPVQNNQITMAHQFIDAGADIIVGHHPHVMQRVETYKDRPIFYSLGNFIFDQYFSIHTMRGMVTHVSIDPETKAMTTTQEISVLDKNYIPQVPIPFDESMLITKTFIP